MPQPPQQLQTRHLTLMLPALPALRCDSLCHPPVRQADTRAMSPAPEEQCCGQDNPLSLQELALQPQGVWPEEARYEIQGQSLATEPSCPRGIRIPPPSPFHWCRGGSKGARVSKLISWVPPAPCWTREIWQETARARASQLEGKLPLCFHLLGPEGGTSPCSMPEEKHGQGAQLHHEK